MRIKLEELRARANLEDAQPQPAKLQEAGAGLRWGEQEGAFILRAGAAKELPASTSHFPGETPCIFKVHCDFQQDCCSDLPSPFSGCGQVGSWTWEDLETHCDPGQLAGWARARAGALCPTGGVSLQALLSEAAGFPGDPENLPP